MQVLPNILHPFPPQGTPFLVRLAGWTLYVMNGHPDENAVMDEEIEDHYGGVKFQYMLMNGTSRARCFFRKGEKFMDAYALEYRGRPSDLVCAIEVAFIFMYGCKMTPSNSLRVWMDLGTDASVFAGFKDLKVMSTFKTMTFTV